MTASIPIATTTVSVLIEGPTLSSVKAELLRRAGEQDDVAVESTELPTYIARLMEIASDLSAARDNLPGIFAAVSAPLSSALNTLDLILADLGIDPNRL